MFKKRMLAVLSLLVVLLTLFLASGVYSQSIQPPPSDDVMLLQAADAGREVQLTGEKLLVIELESNPATGYTWEIAGIDERVLRLTDNVFRTPDVDRAKTGMPRLGAPQIQVLRFAGLREGQSEVRLVYRRPWEPESAPLETYAVSVAVQAPFKGTYAPFENVTPVEISEVIDSAQLTALPTSYNWCDNNGCTSVRNQGSCGSCWAFGTVGVLESAIRRIDGASRDLSEQYLVSCNSDGWDCDGGWWDHDYHQWKKPAAEPDACAVY